MSSVYTDVVFRMLGVNAVLVIAGYAAAVLGAAAENRPVRILKYLFLLISLVVLLCQNLSILRMVWRHMSSLLVLSFFFLLSAFFAVDSLASASVTLTFVVPFLYVGWSVGYLLIRYPVREVLDGFLNMINWVYSLPVISFFLTGGNLSETNIYYTSSEPLTNAFVSNHYGWAGTLFLVTGVDLLRNNPLHFVRRLILLPGVGISFYLVLISGNRTSWLCLTAVSLIFIVRYQGSRVFFKILVSLLVLGTITLLLKDPGSALNARIRKTEIQQRQGEPRSQAAGRILDYLGENPLYFVTGVGMFNETLLREVLRWSGFHNSYYEVLFGGGIFIFAPFFYLVVYRSLMTYWRYFSRTYLFLIPVLIIPFFESNLTGGQFLFFPWFMLTLALSYLRSFVQMKKAAA